MNRVIFIVTIFVFSQVGGCISENAYADDSSSQKIDEKIKVHVTALKKTDAARTLSYSGSINAVRTTDVSFSIPGTVKKVTVEEGDTVKAGQVLAKLDRDLTASSFRAASATEKQAQDAHDRLQTVYKKGSLPAIKWEEILAKLEQAKSTKQMAASSLSKTVMRAPVEGIVSTRDIEVGSNVMPNFPVFRIVDIRNVYVRVSVPESEIFEIKKGQQASVFVSALRNLPLEATVEKIGVQADPVSKTYEVQLILDNSDLLLKPGMVCSIALAINQGESMIAVSPTIVQKDAYGKPYIFIVDEKMGKAVQQSVTVGPYFNNKVRIQEGVRAGQLVVVSGQQKLSNKSPVSIVHRVI